MFSYKDQHTDLMQQTNIKFTTFKNSPKIPRANRKSIDRNVWGRDFMAVIDILSGENREIRRVDSWMQQVATSCQTM